MSAANSFSEGVLVISCDIDESSENVILKILGKDSLPECFEKSNDVKSYEWDIDTKYYTAKISLYSLKKKKELVKDFAAAVRALIFYFDNQKPSSFEDVLSWIPCLKDTEAEVKLLVCNNYSDASESTALEKKDVLDWCVKNEFEIVELNIAHESDDEDEQAFKDVKGYERVIQALESCMWSSMRMKSERSNEVPAKAATNNESSASSSKSESPMKDEKLEALKDAASKVEEDWIKDLTSDDIGDMDFEALFAKFASMKEKAANLTGDERKKFAEEAAIAFWRAMGGDEEEIASLDDED